MKKIAFTAILILMAGMFVGCASTPAKTTSKQATNSKSLFREKIANEEKTREKLSADITGMIINDSDHIQHFMLQVFGYDLDKHENISKDRFFLLTDVQPHESAYFKIPDSLKVGDNSFGIYAWDFDNKKYIPIFSSGTFMFSTRSIKFKYNGIVIDSKIWEYGDWKDGIDRSDRESYDEPYEITFVDAFEVAAPSEEHHF